MDRMDEQTQSKATTQPLNLDTKHKKKTTTLVCFCVTISTTQWNLHTLCVQVCNLSFAHSKLNYCHTQALKKLGPKKIACLQWRSRILCAHHACYLCNLLEPFFSLGRCPMRCDETFEEMAIPPTI